MMQDSSSSACPMIVPAVSDPTAQPPTAPSRAGLTWRHFATVVLLLVTCPILFLAAVLAAPLLLLFLGIDAARKVFELNPPLGSAQPR